MLDIYNYQEIHDFFSENSLKVPHNISNALNGWILVDKKKKIYTRIKEITGKFGDLGFITTIRNAKIDEKISKTFFPNSSCKEILKEIQKEIAQKQEDTEVRKKEELEYIKDQSDLGFQKNFPYFVKKSIDEKDLRGLNYKFISFKNQIVFCSILNSGECFQIIFPSGSKYTYGSMKGAILQQVLTPTPKMAIFCEGIATGVGIRKYLSKIGFKEDYNIFYSLGISRLNDSVKWVRNYFKNDIDLLIMGDYDGEDNKITIQKTIETVLENRCSLWMPANEGKRELDWWDVYNENLKPATRINYNSVEMLPYIERCKNKKSLKAIFDTLNTDQICNLENIVRVDTISEGEIKIEKNIINILSFPMGSGKTQKIIKPFVKDKMADQECIIVSPTRALTKANSKLMEVKHYIEDKLEFKFGIPTSISICINSIINPTYEEAIIKSNVVVFEEFSEILDSIENGTVKDKEKTLDFVISLLRKDYVIISDADFRDRDIFFLKKHNFDIKIYNYKHEVIKSIMAGKEYNVFKCPKLSRQSTEAQAFNDILKHSENGENLYVVSDSKNTANDLGSFLKGKGINHYYVIDSDNINSKKTQEILCNPNSDKLPKILISTPAVRSGVSFESDHFNRVVALNLDYIVSPYALRQMLHRVRACKIFDIYLSRQFNIPILKRTSEEFLSSLYRDYALQQKNYHIDDKYAEFCSLTRAYRARDFINWEYNLFKAARKDGVKINQINIDEEILKETRKHIKNIKKERKENTNKILLDAKDFLCDLDYEMTKNGAESKEENLRIKKHECKKILKKKVINYEDVEFIAKGGLSKLENLSYMLDEEETAEKAREKDIKKHFADTRFREARLKIMKIVGNKILPNPFLRWDSEYVHSIYDEIKNDNILVRFIQVSLNLNFRINNKVMAVHNIIRKMTGLKINQTEDKRHYYFDEKIRDSLIERYLLRKNAASL